MDLNKAFLVKGGKVAGGGPGIGDALLFLQLGRGQEKKNRPQKRWRVQWGTKRSLHRTLLGPK